MVKRKRFARKRGRSSSMVKKSAFKRRRRGSAVAKNTRKIKRLTKRVKRVSQLANQGVGRHTWRQITPGKVECINNAVKFSELTGIKCNTYDTALGNLRFLDANTNALVTKDAHALTGNPARDYLIKSAWAETTCKNNYGTALKVTLYTVVPKLSLNSTPFTMFQEGLANQRLSTGAVENPLAELTDSALFRDAYRIVKKRTKILQPGMQMSMSYGVGNIRYDPTLPDRIVDNYEPKYKNFTFMIRVQGTNCHDQDNSDTQHGTIGGGVDIYTKRKVVVLYDAGVDLDDLTYDDQLDIMSSIPRQSLVNYAEKNQTIFEQSA